MSKVRGKVKWYNTDKGYGFIAPEAGGADHFVHATALERAGIRSLSEGQRVEYELVETRRGKTAAENLAVLA